MERRHFLASSVAASALAVAAGVSAQTSAPPPGREFYQLRRYRLRSGPQTKLTESYFSDAMIPALARMGMGPVGAFQLDFGPETPVFYLLIPGPTAGVLAEVDLRLAEDAAFMKAAEPFWNSTAASPAFERVESSLLAAFAGWPKITPPPGSPVRSNRTDSDAEYSSCHWEQK